MTDRIHSITLILDKDDAVRDRRDGCAEDLDSAIPDFDAPPTLGCLLALVRLAWGLDVHIYEMTAPGGGSLLIGLGQIRVLFKADGGTLAGRRLAALEAAPT